MRYKKTRVFEAADILVPKSADMTKWSVIACDQHTSEPEYWERVDRYVGQSPSTLRLMLPEHMYHSDRLHELIEETRKAMDEYYDKGIFKNVTDSYIYTERTLFSGKLRRGLVGKIDLEHYDYSDKSEALIRATEGVVKEKIPVRIRLREGARAEMPHVLILVDDPQCSLIEPLEQCKVSMEKLYDFDLMEDGGHISGYRVHSEAAGGIDQAIDKLMDPEGFSLRYGCKEGPVLLFATGDGNHSLAAAKACWEKMKPLLTEAERAEHPARFALVELINIWDQALEFEAIHRVVFDCNPQQLLERLMDYYPGAKYGAGEGHNIRFFCGNQSGSITIPEDIAPLAIGALGSFLDCYLESESGRLDFVHGDDVLERLSRGENTIGFVLPAIDKSKFFASIIEGGSMPRKTFSMGNASDKRYYLECRGLE